MKKGICGIALILCMLFITANYCYAVNPTYEFSDSYKNSQYYKNLMNVTLTGNQGTDIVNVALSQYGYTEGNYSGDYGGSSNGSNNYTEYQRMPGVTSGQGVANAGWCAAFVSWCARQAGISTSIIGNSTTSSISNFGLQKTSTPKKGSLAFVQFDSDVNIDHTALVYDVDDTYVYTIEGNRNNKVEKKKYYKSSGKQVNYSATYIEFYGNPAYTETAPTPSAPTNVKVNIYGTDVTVSWSASANATSYDVYLIQSPWGWSDIKYSKSTTSTSYKFTGISPGSYKAFVIARPNNNTVQSSWVSFTVNPLPSAPTNVKVSIYGTDVTVSWNASANATSYDVYLHQEPWSWNDIKYSASTYNTSYTFNNVAPGEYCAFIIARPNTNNIQSTWISFKVYSSAPETPVIRSDVNYSHINWPVIISWDAVPNAEYYLYYITEYPEGYAYTSYTQKGTVTENKLIITGLPSGRYSVLVNAYNTYGGSNRSNWATFDIYDSDYTPVVTKTFNGHIYALYDYEMSWTFARDLCEDMGGHLITITSEEEQQFVSNLMKLGSKDAYWLGAFCSNAETKKYNWVTGEEFDYNAWYGYGDQPSVSGEYGEQQLYAEIREAYYNCWDDVKNTAKNNKGFIIEIEPDEKYISNYIIYKGSKYMLIDKNSTWTEAEQYCKEIGGQLCVIENSDEQKIIDNLLETGTRKWYFLGAKKENDIWNWIDGSSGNNIDWKNNIDGWNGIYLMQYNTGKCIPLDNTYYPADHINNIGFVCEIPCANVESHVEKTDSNYIITNTLYNISEPCEIIALGYNCGTLTNVEKIKYNNENNNIELIGNIDEIRVFVWDSIGGLKPLCTPEIIPESEFITN